MAIADSVPHKTRIDSRSVDEILTPQCPSLFIALLPLTFLVTVLRTR